VGWICLPSTGGFASFVPFSARLRYVISYYPSGSKQRTGSKLDRVVERHRTAVVRDIVAHLRRTTGQDLGEGPEPWIQKYAQR
jgi:hypothetical protein